MALTWRSMADWDGAISESNVAHPADEVSLDLETVEDFEDDTFAISFTHDATYGWERTTADANTGSSSFTSTNGGVDNSTAWFEFTVPEAGGVSLYYRPSSEQGFDYLRITVNGTTEVETSGSQPWTEWNPDSTVVGAGDTVRIEYEKDGSIFDHDDRGYVDDIVLDGGSGSGSLTTATKSFATAQTPDLTGLEYTLNGETVSVDVVGSPGTVDEETVTQSLTGASSYDLTWAQAHTDFEVTLNLSTATFTSPTVSSIALTNPDEAVAYGTATAATATVESATTLTPGINASASPQTTAATPTTASVSGHAEDGAGAVTWETTDDWDGAISETDVSHSADVVSLAELAGGETGRVDLTDTIDSGVTASVTFGESYTTPVVVPYIPTRSGGQSIDARVKNVTGSGCDIFVQEPDNQAHNTETVSYLVVEAGTHEFDGVMVEAGIHSTATVRTDAESATFGDTVTFATSWASAPAVLHGLNTHANADFMSTQANSVTTTDFNLSQEAARTGKESTATTEDIGWIAIENVGAATVNGNAVDVGVANDGTNDGVDNTPHTISFTQTFASAPDIVTKQQTMNGTHGAWARGEGTWSTTQHKTYAEEDQVSNTERGHGDETFGWLATTPDAVLGGGGNYATTGSLTTSTKSFSGAEEPNLGTLSYTLNGQSISVDVVGSPGTVDEETVTQSLTGATSYSLTWTQAHTDYRLTLSLSGDGTATPTVSSLSLLPPGTGSTTVTPTEASATPETATVTIEGLAVSATAQSATVTPTTSTVTIEGLAVSATAQSATVTPTTANSISSDGIVPARAGSVTATPTTANVEVPPADHWGIDDEAAFDVTRAIRERDLLELWMRTGPTGLENTLRPLRVKAMNAALERTVYDDGTWEITDTGNETNSIFIKPPADDTTDTAVREPGIFRIEDYEELKREQADATSETEYEVRLLLRDAANADPTTLPLTETPTRDVWRFEFNHGSIATTKVGAKFYHEDREVRLRMVLTSEQARVVETNSTYNVEGAFKYTDDGTEYVESDLTEKAAVKVHPPTDDASLPEGVYHILDFETKDLTNGYHEVNLRLAFGLGFLDGEWETPVGWGVKDIFRDNTKTVVRTSDGTIYVCTAGLNLDTNESYFTLYKSTDDGLTWTELERLSWLFVSYSGNDYHSSLNMVVDSTDTLHLVIEPQQDGVHLYYQYDPAAEAWAVEAETALNGELEAACDLGVGPNDEIYTVHNGSSEFILLQRNSNGTWSEVARGPSLSDKSRGMTVLPRPNGEVIVVETSDGEHFLRARVWTGGSTLEPYTGVSASDIVIVYSNLVVDENGMLSFMESDGHFHRQTNRLDELNQETTDFSESTWETIRVFDNSNNDWQTAQGVMTYNNGVYRIAVADHADIWYQKGTFDELAGTGVRGNFEHVTTSVASFGEHYVEHPHYQLNQWNHTPSVGLEIPIVGGFEYYYLAIHDP